MHLLSQQAREEWLEKTDFQQVQNWQMLLIQLKMPVFEGEHWEEKQILHTVDMQADEKPLLETMK
jgi:hypothetical protein